MMNRTILVFLLALEIASRVPAQQNNLAEENKLAEDKEFTLYTASQLIVLNAGVQDAAGTNVRGLEAQNFQYLKTDTSKASNNSPLKTAPSHWELS
jgi:hypothetical protein